MYIDTCKVQEQTYKATNSNRSDEKKKKKNTERNKQRPKGIEKIDRVCGREGDNEARAVPRSSASSRYEATLNDDAKKVAAKADTAMTKDENKTDTKSRQPSNY